jgi:hypothetical protein
MHTLYDSDTYSVTHMLANAMAADVASTQTGDGARPATATPTLARHGFEIVDKRTNKEVYLDGSWAELFQQHKYTHPGRGRRHAGAVRRVGTKSGCCSLKERPGQSPGNFRKDSPVGIGGSGLRRVLWLRGSRA